MDAEPLDDFDILVCPFVPFRTCGWCSQPHTVIVAVWHLILAFGWYVVISRSVMDGGVVSNKNMIVIV